MVIPSLVKIDRCKLEPSSSDVPFLQEWKKKWFRLDFPAIKKQWR